jgi:hypothetical protein
MPVIEVVLVDTLLQGLAPHIHDWDHAFIQRVNPDIAEMELSCYYYSFLKRFRKTCSNDNLLGLCGRVLGQSKRLGQSLTMGEGNIGRSNDPIFTSGQTNRWTTFAPDINESSR